MRRAAARTVALDPCAERWAASVLRELRVRDPPSSCSACRMRRSTRSSRRGRRFTG